MNTRKLSLLSAALATALAVAGCGGGGSGPDTAATQEPSPPPAPPPPQPKVESYTAWSKYVLTLPAEGEPEVMDELLVDYDGNNDPNAYADLFPPESPIPPAPEEPT